MDKDSCLYCDTYLKERHVGCHSTCERYKRFAENVKSINKIKKEDSKLRGDLYSSIDRHKRRK